VRSSWLVLLSRRPPSSVTVTMSSMRTPKRPARPPASRAAVGSSSSPRTAGRSHSPETPYHSTKWGIEGFCESVAQEVAPFGIGVTIVEPGGARTEFRYGSARVAQLMPEYDDNPAHAFQAMLDPAAPPAPGDPARMATRIIDIVDIEPAALRMVLGSQALASTLADTLARLVKGPIHWENPCHPLRTTRCTKRRPATDGLAQAPSATLG
jgi:NAD(P)-dependent dehydrogenase (short-subunit alcohol dehydrogenase family)